MVILKNNNIFCEIDEIGAQIKSIKHNGNNRMWSGNPEIWGGVAPILFPICGGLKDDKFRFEGKEYTLQKHGYVRFEKFELETVSDSKATFLHKFNQETLKCFPFKYELRVVYNLTENGINVTYKVDNIDDKKIYFSIGSHEGYYTPEGIEDYDILFTEKETLNACLLDGSILQKNKLPMLKDSSVLPLYDKYFIIDPLVFKDLKSRSVTLRNRKTGRFVKVDFPDNDYFVLWHVHGAPFMCLEPWCGVHDSQETDYDITNKEGIIALDIGKTYNVTHTITFGEE